MNRVMRIFEEYQQADAEQRLAIYMNYRELRADFDEIDRTRKEKVGTQVWCGLSQPPRRWSILFGNKRLTIELENSFGKKLDQ